MKANINGIVQDYKPRLDSEKPKSIPLKTAGECLSALKNYGDDEEIRDAATRKLWMMLKEEREETRSMVQRKMPRFEPTDEQKKEDDIFQSLFVDDKKNDSISRLMERRRNVWGLDDNAQGDTSGELETLYDCIVFIERYGDTRVNREKATKTARRLLSDLEGRLINFDDALSDFHRSIGSGIIPF